MLQDMAGDPRVAGDAYSIASTWSAMSAVKALTAVVHKVTQAFHICFDGVFLCSFEGSIEIVSLYWCTFSLIASLNWCAFINIGGNMLHILILTYPVISSDWLYLLSMNDIEKLANKKIAK